MVKENNIENIQSIWEMTIFLAMAQRNILWSLGLTAPFLPFYYASNLLTLVHVSRGQYHQRGMSVPQVVYH